MYYHHLVADLGPWDLKFLVTLVLQRPLLGFGTKIRSPLGVSCVFSLSSQGIIQLLLSFNFF